MVGDIFGVIGEVITEFSSAIANVFTSVGGLFYTPGTNGSPGSMTLLGTLLLIAVGTGLVMWAFRTIRGLVRRA